MKITKERVRFAFPELSPPSSSPFPPLPPRTASSVRQAHLSLNPQSVGIVNPYLPFTARSHVGLSRSQILQSLTTILRDLLPFICDKHFVDLKSSALLVDEWLGALNRALQAALDFSFPQGTKLSDILNTHFDQVAHILTLGTSGYDPFTLLLELMSPSLDTSYKYESIIRLLTFKVPVNAPYFDFGPG